MNDDLLNRLKDGADRFLKHMCKQQYSGPPVLSIPRHDGNIDSLLIEAVKRIEELADEGMVMAQKLDAAEVRLKMAIHALQEIADGIVPETDPDTGVLIQGYMSDDEMQKIALNCLSKLECK